MQESIESRVARNQCDVAYLQSRLEKIESDLRDLRKLIDEKCDRIEARFERKLDALDARLI